MMLEKKKIIQKRNFALFDNVILKFRRSIVIAQLF